MNWPVSGPWWGASSMGRRLYYQRLWQAGGWLLVTVVVVLSLMPTPPVVSVLIWDKLQHLAGYTVLMFWFRQAFGPQGRWVALLVGLGVILEVLQGLGGYRYFEWVDMLANVLGVGCGLLLAATPVGRLMETLDRWLARQL